MSLNRVDKAHLIPDTDIQGGPKKVPLEHALDKVPPDPKGAIVYPDDVAAKFAVEVCENELKARGGRGDAVHAMV